MCLRIRLAQYLPEEEGALLSEGSTEPHLSEGEPDPFLLFPPPSIWKRRETQRCGSCQSLITSTESAKKTWKLTLYWKEPRGPCGHLQQSVCHFFFLFSSLGPPSSKFPFFLSKKQEDRLSLRDFKGVFWILSLQTELLRHPQILLHQDPHNLKLRESVCSHHQLLVLIFHPDTLY